MNNINNKYKLKLLNKSYSDHLFRYKIKNYVYEFEIYRDGVCNLMILDNDKNWIIHLLSAKCCNYIYLKEKIKKILNEKYYDSFSINFSYQFIFYPNKYKGLDIWFDSKKRMTINKFQIQILYYILEDVELIINWKNRKIRY